MYLDPNVFLGEVMEMGENSKLWLKNLEKCLVFVWGMLCVERDFDFSDVWKERILKISVCTSWLAFCSNYN